MPIFEKRRFQHGALTETAFDDVFPRPERDYRQAFAALYA
jgi:asparagine synthase (glutamine-hydrolysing)